jgi:predicted PurR-regulated permease PerM
MPAVIFTVYAIVVSGIDNVLKPLLMGRGLDVPMPVILVGTIGGMLLSGVVGLFIGAVILALGYKLFTAWVFETPESGAESGDVVE